MKLKSLVLVVVVLAALSGVVYWVNRPAPPPEVDSRVGHALVDPGLIEQAAKLKITDQGKTVELTRLPDATWRDDSYYGLPADFSKLSSFINDLSGAKLDRLVTTSPARVARLDFNGTKVELLGAGGKDLWAVELGKNADQGGRFVKFPGETKAYLSGVNAWLDTDAKSWADSTLLNVKSDDVAKIEVPLDDGKTVTLSRAKKEDAWTASPLPAGKTLKADKAGTILSSLSSLHFSDSSELADPNVAAAKAHLKTYRLTTFDGKTYTVALGRKPEEKKLKPATAKMDVSFKDKDKEPKPEKPPTPEYDTVPAGPVYAWVTPSTPALDKRAFQVDEYTFTSLPAKSDDLFDAAPAAATPAPEKK